MDAKGEKKGVEGRELGKRNGLQFYLYRDRLSLYSLELQVLWRLLPRALFTGR